MKPTILLSIKVIVYLLWPTTVYAASITLGDTIQGVPLLAWLMVLIVSTLSGLAALLNRIKTDMPPRLGLYITAHMAGSLLAGLLTFFVCEQADLADMTEAVSIALAAYAGAALMDKWAAKFTERVAA